MSFPKLEARLRVPSRIESKASPDAGRKGSTYMLGTAYGVTVVGEWGQS